MNTNNLMLFDNIQFIYELILAKLELDSLGVKYHITNELKNFVILNNDDNLIELVKNKTAYFKSINNQPTNYFHITRKNRTKSVNQYLTHWMYPYKGKFHPQMVRALLNIIKLKEGETVCDPFSGSGTTAIEAQLLGINFIGIDISPICILQGNVKTKSIDVIDEIISIKNDIILKYNNNFFDKKTYYDILNNITNENVKNFFILTRLIVISDNVRRNRNIEQSFIKNINLMIDSIKDYKEIVNNLKLTLGKVNLELGDARKINLPSNSIDGIITSPPYSIALDYIKNDKHSFDELNYNIIDISNNFIGIRGNTKNKIEFYNEDMKQVYSEIYRILKPNKYAVIIVGNASYKKEEIETINFTKKCMEDIGFKFIKSIDKIIFGLYNVMKQENIFIFKKI